MASIFVPKEVSDTATSPFDWSARLHLEHYKYIGDGRCLCFCLSVLDRQVGMTSPAKRIQENKIKKYHRLLATDVQHTFSELKKKGFMARPMMRTPMTTHTRWLTSTWIDLP